MHIVSWLTSLLTGLSQNALKIMPHSTRSFPPESGLVNKKKNLSLMNEREKYTHTPPPPIYGELNPYIIFD